MQADSHQEIHRTFKVRFFFRFCIIRVVRKCYIQKTLIFTNLRTEIADSKASFYNKELCLNRSPYLYCLL